MEAAWGERDDKRGWSWKRVRGAAVSSPPARIFTFMVSSHVRPIIIKWLLVVSLEIISTCKSVLYHAGLFVRTLHLRMCRLSDMTDGSTVIFWLQKVSKNHHWSAKRTCQNPSDILHVNIHMEKKFVPPKVLAARITGHTGVTEYLHLAVSSSAGQTLAGKTADL